ncbi:MAG: Asp-tRNA(Asn)/Glu-tRNA(Gln) amidotransferase subunit GatB [Gemmatimonadota bacterium]
MSGSAGRTYETVIGVEVHVQLRTATKMYCGCSTRFGADPNTQVCPVCLGLPGSLPVANRAAVELAVRAAVSLGCRVHARSEFVRKNYFYPDLPKGYQITQFEYPLATDGRVRVRLEGKERSVRIRRLHLEEDSGKSLHDRFAGSTAVDLNRAGVPLVEIVTEPDLRSPAEARAYLVRLRQLLKHFAAVSDCNMEEGSLRVDANLSVRPIGEEGMGTKTEVKNLNSFSQVEKALMFERSRHIRQLEAGGVVVQETRLFDAARGETRSLRSKEEALDYRYFPEPDLPPLELEPDAAERARAMVGELPDQLESRFMEGHGLSEYDAALVSANPGRARYFEEVVDGNGPDFAKATVNLMMGRLAAELKRRDEASEADLLPPERLRRVVELRLDGTLSSDTAGEVLDRLLSAKGADLEVDDLVRAGGLAQVGDTDLLAGWIEAVIAGHPDEASRYAAGEDRLLGFFMGALMKEASGRADPRKARALLVERLARLRGGG